MKGTLVFTLLLMILSVKAENNVKKVITDNQKFEIVLLENWSLLKSQSPKVKIIVQQDKRESFVLTELPNIESVDVVKINFEEDIKSSLKGNQNLLRNQVFTNDDKKQFRVFTASDGRTDKLRIHYIFFSDKTTIYRVVCCLTNDKSTISKLKKLLNTIKKIDQEK